MCLGRAVRILRRQLFEDFPKFEGSFNKSFTASVSVPAVLIHFVRMLLEGPNIESIGSSEEPTGSNAELSISQLIRYNSIKHKRKENVQSIRHSLERETPLPLYVCLMIHAVTKKKKIIDKLYRLGLSVSYNRVQEISATVTNVLCTKYKEDGVHPPKLCPNVFVTSAIDNIDHNQSSSTAVTSFHGSNATIIQHPCSEAVTEIYDDSIRIQQWNKQIVNGLPEYYTTPPATGKVRSDPPLVTVNSQYIGHDLAFTPRRVLNPWLNSVLERLNIEDTQNIDYVPRVSFADFHAKNEPGVRKIRCNAPLLPLLNDEIATPAMVRHMMDIIIIATAKLNGNQAPVITCDQPVYAIGKQLQWKFPEKYGEDLIILMMGGLHIEMMVINLLGKLLTGSGWTDLVTTAGIATSGVAET